MELSQKLKELRKKQGLTQLELAERLFVSRQAIIRATGNLDWTIEANGTVLADTSFTMSAGETVRIRANYSPENASLDFGLVDSNEKFHYINVTTGSIDKTIEIPENGSYTLVIRNNLSKSVKVTGIVTY